MITREAINEFDAKDVGGKLQEDLDAYKAELANVSDLEFLKGEEVKLMDVMSVYDEYLRNASYALPNSSEHDGNYYTKKDIADRIVSFINKNEVEFQYTEGLYQLSKLWRNVAKVTTLDYYKYDSTLRVLGQLRYKGYKEWNDILAINSYFSTCHDQYTKDTSYSIYLAQRHNAIMDKMQELSNGVDPATGTESVDDVDLHEKKTSKRKISK